MKTKRYLSHEEALSVLSIQFPHGQHRFDAILTKFGSTQICFEELLRTAGNTQPIAEDNSFAPTFIRSNSTTPQVEPVEPASARNDFLKKVSEVTD